MPTAFQIWEKEQSAREAEWDRLTISIGTHLGWTSLARRVPAVSSGYTKITGFPPGYQGERKSHWEHERIPDYATDIREMRALWAKLERPLRRRAHHLLEIIVYRSRKEEVIDGRPYCLDDVREDIMTAPCWFMAEAYLKAVTEERPTIAKEALES